MARRKSKPQTAPSTLPEAIALIERYLVLEHEIAAAVAEADKAIAAIQATRDELVAPFGAEVENIFLQLRAWWSVAGPDIAKDRKSIELAGANIGLRMTPGKLKNPKGVKKDADAVLLVQAIVATWPGAKDLLRTKIELEKKEIVKRLNVTTSVCPITLRLREMGFTVAQGDEFFIDRAAPKEADPDVVDVPKPEIVEARP